MNTSERTPTAQSTNEVANPAFSQEQIKSLIESPELNDLIAQRALDIAFPDFVIDAYDKKDVQTGDYLTDNVEYLNRESAGREGHDHRTFDLARNLTGLTFEVEPVEPKTLAEILEIAKNAKTAKDKTTYEDSIDEIADYLFLSNRSDNRILDDILNSKSKLGIKLTTKQKESMFDKVAEIQSEYLYAVKDLEELNIILFNKLEQFINKNGNFTDYFVNKDGTKTDEKERYDRQIHKILNSVKSPAVKRRINVDFVNAELSKTAQEVRKQFNAKNTTGNTTSNSKATTATKPVDNTPLDKDDNSKKPLETERSDDSESDSNKAKALELKTLKENSANNGLNAARSEYFERVSDVIESRSETYKNVKYQDTPAGKVFIGAYKDFLVDYIEAESPKMVQVEKDKFIQNNMNNLLQHIARVDIVAHEDILHLYSLDEAPKYRKITDNNSEFLEIVKQEVKRGVPSFYPEGTAFKNTVTGRAIVLAYNDHNFNLFKTKFPEKGNDEIIKLASAKTRELLLIMDPTTVNDKVSKSNRFAKKIKSGIKAVGNGIDRARTPKA